MNITEELFKAAKAAKDQGIEARDFADEYELEVRDVLAIFKADSYASFRAAHPTKTSAEKPNEIQRKPEAIIPLKKTATAVSTAITLNAQPVMEQVSAVADKLYTRVKKIDLSKEFLDASDISDMKLHLEYTKTYAILAKVALEYLKQKDA
jgi:hypothetical protein